MLRALIQDETVKVALAPFCLGGACGDLLDNDEHRLGLRPKAEYVFAAPGAWRKFELGLGPLDRLPQPLALLGRGRSLPARHRAHRRDARPALSLRP